MYGPVTQSKRSAKVNSPLELKLYGPRSHISDYRFVTVYISMMIVHVDDRLFYADRRKYRGQDIISVKCRVRDVKFKFDSNTFQIGKF